MSGPLAGRVIVNTRAPHQAAELDERLRDAGAQTLAYPCIDIKAPADLSALDGAVRALMDGEFDWLVLTSSNVVDVLADRMRACGQDRVPATVQVAVIGRRTGDSCRRRLGCTPAVLPSRAIAEALLDALPVWQGERVLLPQSDLARSLLADGLARRGARVTTLTAYHTVLGSGGDDVPRLLAEGRVDAVACTSPSTVRGLVQRITLEGAPLDALRGIPVVCIGPITEAAAVTLGLSTVTAHEHSLDGLMAALLAHYLPHRGADDSPHHATDQG